MNSFWARIYSHCFILASIIGLLGSTYLANCRLARVYSCAQKTKVSFGRCISFCKEKKSCSAVPPRRRPHPAMKRVSAQKRKGILVLVGVTCVTMKLTWSSVCPGVSMHAMQISPMVIVSRSFMVCVCPGILSGFRAPVMISNFYPLDFFSSFHSKLPPTWSACLCVDSIYLN